MPILPKFIYKSSAIPINISTDFNWFQGLLKKLEKSSQHCISIKINRSRNKTRNPQINPHIYQQRIFDKGSKAIQMMKDSIIQ